MLHAVQVPCDCLMYAVGSVWHAAPGCLCSKLLCVQAGRSNNFCTILMNKKAHTMIAILKETQLCARGWTDSCLL